MTCRSINETLEYRTFPDPAPFFDAIVESDIQLLDAAAEQLKDVVGLLENGEISPHIKTIFEPVNGDALSLECLTLTICRMKTGCWTTKK